MPYSPGEALLKCISLCTTDDARKCECGVLRKWRLESYCANKEALGRRGCGPGNGRWRCPQQIWKVWWVLTPHTMPYTQEMGAEGTPPIMALREAVFVLSCNCTNFHSFHSPGLRTRFLNCW